MIRISLVVPTYNRADYLTKSLESFTSQSLDKNSYEIILVDNNSNDNTKSVFESFVKKYTEHNWVYFFEPKQGLHYARNRGILLAKGHIVVFGDDDIEASPQWLELILDSFEKDNKIGVVGGPVYPLWDGQPPDWIYDYGTKDFHGVFAYLNYGGKSRYLEKEEYVFGCNFAIRKRIAIEINGSGPDTFPTNMIHYSGRGECAMLDRVRDKGYKIYYAAKASVSHYTPISRCSLNYFINRYQRWAVESIYHQYNTGLSLSKIFLSLMNQSIHILISLGRHLVVSDKINKKNFLIIMTKQMLFGWKHYWKLISDHELRDYTGRTRFLDELEIMEKYKIL